MYRCFLLPIFLFFSFNFSNAQSVTSFFQQTDDFLKKHVSNGQVYYKKINTKELRSITQLIGSIDYKNLPDSIQKAYLINVYNILVIQAVKEQYPIASPLEVTGFFDWKEYKIGGKKLTINDLEKKELLVKFKDPRLHFALVCAAKSCPPIHATAFQSGNIEQLLNQQTIGALNDESFIYLKPAEKTAYLSQIFRWYADDFKIAGGIRSFINQYRKEPIPADYKIRYYDYNWQLNDAQPVLRSGNPAFFRASRLLRKKQFELKLFNSLYTQKNYDGFEQLNTRSSYFSSFVQYLHGSNKSYNLGFDFVVRSHVVNDFVGNSPLKAIQAFNFDEFRTYSNGDSLSTSDGSAISTYGRFGLAHFGPKIKFHPFRNNRNFSLQQTVYIPLQMKVDGQTISFTQLFYDRLIGTRTQLFVEASLWMPLSPTFRVDPFLKVFYSYFPTSRWTVYGMVGLPNEVGAGMKFLVSKHFEVELLYTNYAIEKIVRNSRRAQTFNIGFRFMR